MPNIDLMKNLYKYKYKHIKPFIKDHINHHKMMNFKGEVYEASFYEAELRNAEIGREEEISIIAKGPYSQDRKPTKTGFFNDQSDSLIFNSNSISLAEFDCLKIGKDTVRFYECTLTQKPENLRSLKSEALRKSAILKILFPTKKISCTVVSNNEATLEFFRKREEFNVLHYELPQINLVELAKNARIEKIPHNNKLTSASELNKIISSFDYLEEFEKICSTFFAHNSTSSVAQKIISSNGLYQRLYWGKIPTQYLDPGKKSSNSKDVIVSINLSSIRAPKLRYYFTDDNGRSFFESLPTPKKLNHWKSSRAELIRIHKKLPSRSKQDLEKLEHELADWHNNWFKPLTSLAGSG